MPTMTVSTKGWVVIPAEYRKKYDVHAGTEVEVVDFGGGMSLVPRLAHPIREAQGMLRGKRKLTTALLAGRAEERNRDPIR
ncbi:MAG: AbrB/MazE/SpoVT family DNA-binding domain-containing protein [Lentisphaeria bacterium]